MGSIQTPREIVRNHLMARDPCETCGGTGEGPIASEQDCEDCHGAGYMQRSPERLGEELRCLFEETLRRDLGDQRRDEVGTAMDHVDWTRLALNCIQARR